MDRFGRRAQKHSRGRGARTLFAALAFLLLLASAREAKALCGADTRGLPEVYAASDAVFMGTALRIWVPYVPARSKDRCFSRVNEMLVDFRVLRSWKGVTETFVTVDNSSFADLGTPIAEGRTYLVWAKRAADGRLTLPNCGRTSTIAGRLSDVQWLIGETALAEESDARLDGYSLGITAMASGQYAEAIALLEPLAADPMFRHRRECRIKLGVAYEKIARYEQAVDILGPELDLRNDAIWDPRTGNGLRAEAQWSVALSFLHLGDYKSALQAIEDSEKRHPTPRNCGDGRSVDEFRNEVYRGLALEHLGRYPEAVQAYVRASAGIHQDPTPALRLADLYESTGQWEKLKTFVAATDDPRLATIRRVVKLREHEHRGELEYLFAAFHNIPHVGAPWDPKVRRQHWERWEVAALLARNPAEATRLKDRASFRYDRGVLFYTLGLVGTKEAAAALRDQVLIDPVQGYRTEVLTYALSLAGEPGREVLDELAKAYPAVATYRAKKYPRHWFLDEGLEFPPLPTATVLPSLDPRLPGVPGPS